MNRWVNLPGIQNPVIVCQISKDQPFAASVSVRIGKTAYSGLRANGTAVMRISSGGAVTSARFNSPTKTPRTESIAKREHRRIRTFVYEGRGVAKMPETQA